MYKTKLPLFASKEKHVGKKHYLFQHKGLATLPAVQVMLREMEQSNVLFEQSKVFCMLQKTHMRPFSIPVVRH